MNMYVYNEYIHKYIYVCMYTCMRIKLIFLPRNKDISQSDKAN